MSPESTRVGGPEDSRSKRQPMLWELTAQMRGQNPTGVLKGALHHLGGTDEAEDSYSIPSL